MTPTSSPPQLRTPLSHARWRLALIAVLLWSGQPGQAADAAPFAMADEAAFFAHIRREAPALQALDHAVAGKDWPAAKEAWRQYLIQRSQPRWTFSHHDKAAIVELLARRYDGLPGTIRNAQAQIAKLQQGRTDWYLTRNEATHALQRHGNWVTLGQAYWISGDETYARHWVGQLRDWLDTFPAAPPVAGNYWGTPWRSLENGVRNYTWPEVVELFIGSPSFDAESVFRMTRSLLEQARRLYLYEDRYKPGNWQINEATGLAATGVMFSEFDESASWRERGFALLVQHMDRDVYPDGAHHELAPGYHGWTMSDFLLAARLADSNGLDVPGLSTRLERMYEFYLRIRQPNGGWPTIADCHEGSISTAMGMGAVLFRRADMRYLCSEDKVPVEAVWRIGAQAVAGYEAMAGTAPPFTSTVLPQAQWAMMRTGWGARDDYLLFDAGPYGGGHSHASQLQIILWADGHGALVDLGQISYDDPFSVQLRTSSAHNVVTVDGRVRTAKAMGRSPGPLTWETGADGDLASADVDLGDGIIHRRTVVFVKPDYYVVVDHLRGSGSHAMQRRFHVAPGATVTADGATVRCAFKDAPDLQMVAADGTPAMVEPPLYAPRESASVTFTATTALPWTAWTVLVPHRREGMAAVRLDGGVLTVTFPTLRSDRLMVAEAPSELALGTARAKARALVVRGGPRAATIVLGAP